MTIFTLGDNLAKDDRALPHLFGTEGSGNKTYVTNVLYPCAGGAKRNGSDASQHESTIHAKLCLQA
eukprot:3103004-Amphidinium_carterae.1